MLELKRAAIRGSLANITSQGVNTILRVGVLIVLARLLTPSDFGIVGMVTTMVGALHLFKDFGLSTATIQRTTITDQELSALFWINILVGTILTIG